MENTAQLLPLDEDLEALAARIQTMGGIVVPYEQTARVVRPIVLPSPLSALRVGCRRLRPPDACAVAHLAHRLARFPAIVNNEEVYLC